MEQIVKIFVHQSYFIENDLVVDYNVEQGALESISQKDWIALIPKGWTGIGEQVAFKTVDTDSSQEKLAIKSIVMEKNCFLNVVECEKYYQLMYISQNLEILGRSEYFLFLHKSGICDFCVPSIKKTESKESSGKNKLASTFSRKTLRRQSPTPHEFYKHQSQSQNNVKSQKSKQWLVNKCIKCNAPTNFAAVESAYLAKIQDLTITNEQMEQDLLKLEKDLINTLEVINQQFKFNKTISQQKCDIQKFIDDLVVGLLKDDRVTFWAQDQEFSVVREFPDQNQVSFLPDDTTTAILPVGKSLNMCDEERLKAIIGHQEQKIRLLVNQIQDIVIFFEQNMGSVMQNSSTLTLSKNKTNNIGYMDISGTTYFSPPQCINNTLNDFNLYLQNSIENIVINKKKYNRTNNTNYDTEYPVNLESKVMSTLNNSVKAIKPLTLEYDWQKDKNECTQIPKKPNEPENNTLAENNNLEDSDDSL